jgi:predicted amidohydrolase YtcJ
MHSRPEERLPAHDAVGLFTRNAARLAFEEHRKGTLEEGKQGDLVVLRASPLEVLPEEISAIQVLMTIHRGRIVYEG